MKAYEGAEALETLNVTLERVSMPGEATYHGSTSGEEWEGEQLGIWRRRCTVGRRYMYESARRGCGWRIDVCGI